MLAARKVAQLVDMSVVLKAGVMVALWAVSLDGKWVDWSVIVKVFLTVCL